MSNSRPLLVALLALVVVASSGCMYSDVERRMGAHMYRDAQLAVAGDAGAAARLVSATAVVVAIVGEPDAPVTVAEFPADVAAGREAATARGRVVNLIRSGAATVAEFGLGALCGALGLGGAFAMRGRLVQIARVGLNVLNTIRGGGVTWASVRTAAGQVEEAVTASASSSTESPSSRPASTRRPSPSRRKSSRSSIA